MKKIVFDIEDRPPPSYYKEMAQLQLESQNKVSPKVIDKSEWWKAPEFVPRAQRTDIAMVHQPHPQPQLQQKIQASIERNVASTNCSGNQFPSIELPLMTPARPQPMNFTISRMPMPITTIPITSQQQFRPIFPPALSGTNLVRPFLPPIHFISQMPQFRKQSLKLVPNYYPKNIAVRPNIPRGYSANVTTINSGLGAHIPAIVIKKRRKKKSKTVRKDQTDAFEHQGEGTKHEGKESSPDDSSLIKNQPAEKRLSEPDLTELRKTAPSNNFPADLDLIQSTTNCTMLTGSWPDLSEPQRQFFENSNSFVYYDNNNEFDEDESKRELLNTSTIEESAEDSNCFTTADDTQKDEEAVGLLDEFYKHNSKGRKKKEESPDSIKFEESRIHSVIVHATGNSKTESEIIRKTVGQHESGSGPGIRTFSLPDVHTMTSTATKVCCSVM